jgi:hypothetical protein
MTATVVCRYCMQRAHVRADGRLAIHHITLPVSARAVNTVGAGSVKRRCSGSARPAAAAGRAASP